LRPRLGLQTGVLRLNFEVFVLLTAKWLKDARLLRTNTGIISLGVSRSRVPSHDREYYSLGLESLVSFTSLYA